MLVDSPLRRLDGTSFQVTLSSRKQIAEVRSCLVNKLSTLANVGKLACLWHMLDIIYILSTINSQVLDVTASTFIGNISYLSMKE